MANSKPPTPTLKLISHNAQGPNSAIKPRKLFQLYQTMSSDILLLQETHFPATFRSTFLHQRYPQFFLTNMDNKTKGVAICFSKHINFSETEEIIDPLIRYILVSGTIDGETYTFISYYTPNKGQAKFF